MIATCVKDPLIFSSEDDGEESVVEDSESQSTVRRNVSAMDIAISLPQVNDDGASSLSSCSFLVRSWKQSHRSDDKDTKPAMSRSAIHRDYAPSHPRSSPDLFNFRLTSPLARQKTLTEQQFASPTMPQRSDSDKNTLTEQQFASPTMPQRSDSDKNIAPENSQLTPIEQAIPDNSSKPLLSPRVSASSISLSNTGSPGVLSSAASRSGVASIFSQTLTPEKQARLAALKAQIGSPSFGSTSTISTLNFLPPLKNNGRNDKRLRNPNPSMKRMLEASEISNEIKMMEDASIEYTKTSMSDAGKAMLASDLNLTSTKEAVSPRKSPTPSTDDNRSSASTPCLSPLLNLSSPQQEMALKSRWESNENDNSPTITASPSTELLLNLRIRRLSSGRMPTGSNPNRSPSQDNFSTPHRRTPFGKKAKSVDGLFQRSKRSSRGELNMKNNRWDASPTPGRYNTMLRDGRARSRSRGRRKTNSCDGIQSIALEFLEPPLESHSCRESRKSGSVEETSYQQGTDFTDVHKNVGDSRPTGGTRTLVQSKACMEEYFEIELKDSVSSRSNSHCPQGQRTQRRRRRNSADATKAHSSWVEDDRITRSARSSRRTIEFQKTPPVDAEQLQTMRALLSGENLSSLPFKGVKRLPARMGNRSTGNLERCASKRSNE